LSLAAAKSKPPLQGRARVVSVFGPFNSRALLEMSAEVAGELLGEALALSGGSNVIEAVERDLAELRERDERLAESGLAAAAMAMAYEIEHPYNSATSKSMCAKVLRETIDRLHELAPPEQEKDELDAILDGRRERLEGSPAA